MRELKNPIKIKIPFKLLECKNTNPLYQLGYYLQATLDTNLLINVTKIWINQQTDRKIDNLLINFIMKSQKISNKLARQHLGIVKLMQGPSIDLYNDLNLEDDYIYIEEDYDKSKQNHPEYFI